MAGLKRTLGLTEVIFFGAGSILGAGIYAIIGKVSGFGGNMTWLSFTIASITAMLSAFSYAELSSMYPQAGGEYVYLKKSMSKKMAIIIGLVITLNGIISGATVSIAFAGYLSNLWEISLFLACVGIIALVWLVNVIGIRQSSVMNIIFTIIEMGGLLIVLYISIPYWGEVNYFELPEGGVNYIFVGAALSYFAYIGFEEIVKLSEETIKPEKNIPKALFSATGIVMIVYFLVAIAAVSVIPWEQLSQSDSPLSDVVESEMGKTGVTIITLVALFSTTNTILSNMMGSSRVLYTMGQDNKKLSLFSRILPKNKTPFPALVLVSIVMIAFAAIGKLEVVALIANFFIFITFLFVNISVIVLRKKDKDAERPFRVPLNIGNVSVLSYIAVAATLLLLGYSIYGLTLTEW